MVRSIIIIHVLLAVLVTFYTSFGLPAHPDFFVPIVFANIIAMDI